MIEKQRTTYKPKAENIIKLEAFLSRIEKEKNDK
jgi:hypothetical protein